jgi:hypothetical protein
MGVGSRATSPAASGDARHRALDRIDPVRSILHELSQGHFTCSSKPGEDVALIIDPDFFR